MTFTFLSDMPKRVYQYEITIFERAEQWTSAQNFAFYQRTRYNKTD